MEKERTIAVDLDGVIADYDRWESNGKSESRGLT